MGICGIDQNDYEKCLPNQPRALDDLFIGSQPGIRRNWEESESDSSEEYLSGLYIGGTSYSERSIAFSSVRSPKLGVRTSVSDLAGRSIGRGSTAISMISYVDSDVRTLCHAFRDIRTFCVLPPTRTLTKNAICSRGTSYSDGKFSRAQAIALCDK